MTYVVHLYVGVLGLDRLCKWAVYAGPDRHCRVCAKDVAHGRHSPAQMYNRLSRVGLSRVRVGPRRLYELL
jgi:hypothetical protein